MKLKIEPVPWNYYVLRRRLVLDKWLVAKNLKTKKDLDAWCTKNGVAPPEKNHAVWGIMRKVKKPAPKIEVDIRGFEGDGPRTPEETKKIIESWDNKPTKKSKKTKGRKTKSEDTE